MNEKHWPAVITSRNRQFPQTLSGSRKYGIAYGRRDQGHGGFADAARSFIALDEVHVEFGQLVVAQHAIVVEVGLPHLAAGYRHLAAVAEASASDRAAAARRLMGVCGFPSTWGVLRDVSDAFIVVLLVIVVI
jgi:hypothetical protein